MAGLKDWLRRVPGSSKADIIEEHVVRALHGDVSALKFIFEHASSIIADGPQITFDFLEPGDPCPKCGKTSRKPPWVSPEEENAK